MDALALADRVRRACGRAATMLGAWCDAYRPSDATNPLQPQNRFMKLQAAFSSPGGEFAGPTGYGEAAWWGLFDSAYTRAGDYLVRQESAAGAGDGGIWFIAQQQPLLPVLCVRTPRMVSFMRPAPSTSSSNSGVGSYGGFTLADATVLLSDYPASVISGYGPGLDPTDLPGDAPPRSWQVLLPTAPGLVLLVGDLMSDDLGRRGVVSSAELTDLGWRLLVKQATT
jgi:hypothetical protein